MTNTILSLCLEAVHIPFLTTLFVSGFVFYRRDVFARVLILLFFTMIFNPWLKSIWQIPLPPSLGKEGWAFPSGHMQAAFVVYAWLAWEFRQIWLSVGIALLLTGIGIALVYFGYHYPPDVIAAVFFGLLSDIVFATLLRTHLGKPSNLWLLSSLAALIGIIIIILMPMKAIQPHSGMGLGFLLGFSIGWYVWTPLEGEYKRLRFGFKEWMYLGLIALSMGARWFADQQLTLSPSLFWQNFWLYGATALTISLSLPLSKQLSVCFQRTASAR